MKKMKFPLLFLAILAIPLLSGCAALSLEGVLAEPPPDGPPIRAYLATDEFLSGFDGYFDLSWFEDGQQRIAFTSREPIYGFSFLELGYDDGFYVENVLITQKELLPDRPIVLMWTRGDVPHRGVSFMDEDGETRYFALEMSDEGIGGDSLSLLEF